MMSASLYAAMIATTVSARVIAEHCRSDL
jgi:hypothetical protein